MATTDIIKFYSGTKADLSDATDTIANCIGLQTDTNRLFWKINGNTKIYLQAAWADINNKPQYLSDSSFLVNAIQDALSDALSSLDTAVLLNQDIEIPSSSVTIIGQETQRRFIYRTGKKALPCWIQGASLHNIQPQSVSINSYGTLDLQLSRYLAYQNINSAITAFPSGWKLCYR